MSGCWCHAERSPVTDRKEKQKVFKLLEILLGKTRLSIPVRVPGLAGKRRENAVCTGTAKKRKNPRWRDLSVPHHTGIAVKCQLWKKGIIKEKTGGKREITQSGTATFFTYIFWFWWLDKASHFIPTLNINHSFSTHLLAAPYRKLVGEFYSICARADKCNDFFKRSSSYTSRVPCSIPLLHQENSLTMSWESYSCWNSVICE